MDKPKILCDFVLKAKYNGIQIGANGQPIRNGEMTNEIAIELMEWHPLGKGLFDVCPTDEELSEIKGDENISLAELRIKYPDIKSNSKDKFLKKLAEQEEE